LPFVYLYCTTSFGPKQSTNLNSNLLCFDATRNVVGATIFVWQRRGLSENLVCD
jgi:hypothetical protein